jgi:hypothetical protein
MERSQMSQDGMLLLGQQPIEALLQNSRQARQLKEVPWAQDIGKRYVTTPDVLFDVEGACCTGIDFGQLATGAD